MLKPPFLQKKFIIFVGCLQMYVAFITPHSEVVSYSDYEEQEARDNKYSAEIPYLLKKYKLDDEFIEQKVMKLIGRFIDAGNDSEFSYTDEEKESQAIVDAWQTAGFEILTMRYDVSGKPVFQSGHSFVLWHPELPQFVIKFDKVIERLVGLEKLHEVFAKKKWPIVLPKKYMVGPEEGPWLLVVEKIAFTDSNLINELLEKSEDKLEELKHFLYLAGYCDGNKGNIKLLSSGDFGVIDTDDTYFREPSTLCGASRRLSKYVLGYKDPVCALTTNTTIN
jgi:hypothetical protein